MLYEVITSLHLAELHQHNPVMCAHMHGSLNRWLMGYPDRALVTAVAGQSLADNLKPHERLYLDFASATVANLRGAYAEALEFGNAIQARAAELGHKLVITSYSIHYTKLYELSLKYAQEFQLV